MPRHNSDPEVLALLNDGYDVSSVASRLGVSGIYVRKVISRHEAHYEPKTKSELFPYGITNDSHAMRVRLGYILYNLFEKNDSKSWITSRMTGLNRYELIAAMGRPWNHDWKISQIERVCQASGLPISDVLVLKKSDIKKR